MFVFKKIATFWAPVKITLPGGEVQECECEFVYLDDQQWGAKSKLSTFDFLKEHWKGWRGIVDENEQEVPFSDAQLEAFLGHAYIATGALAGYSGARAGLRAKN